MATFRIVRGNTAPTYTLTCTRDGTAIDLTGATVKVVVKSPSGSITNAAQDDATVTSAAGGIITYTAETAAIFDAVGTFLGDIKITYSDGSVEILRDRAKWKCRDKN